MKWQRCELSVHPREGKQIWIHEELVEQLSLPNRSTIWLRFGTYQMEVTLNVRSDKRTQCRITPDVFNGLHLPFLSRTGIRWHQNALELGPLIGLLTEGKPRTPQQPFGNRSNYIKSFLKANSSFGYRFAFSLQDVNESSQSIDGFFLDDAGRWHNYNVPFPHVIHNRLPTRASENSDAMRKWRRLVLEHRLSMFNWSCFDKWNVHQALLRHPNATRYVPETYLSPDRDLMMRALEDHPTWYLKPIRGCLGIGIYRVHQKSSGVIRIESTNRSKTETLEFKDIRRMHHWLSERHDSFRNYVIQRAIDLRRLDGEPVDFRVHMNKNASNQWVVSGIGAKKAGKGSITTHVRNGGTMYRAEEAIERMFDRSVVSKRMKQLEDAAMTIAQSVEREWDTPLGELGLDLGFDRDGHVWMFEVNAKPGRSIFKLPQLKDASRWSYRSLMDYAVYLSEQTTHARPDSSIGDET